MKKQFPKVNLHTHTCYCDGKNTPEEIVLAALDAGMETIGFSGHSYLAHDPSWCMNAAEEARYRADILHLRERFGERIEILMGVEQDYYSPRSEQKWDYTIGSVHCIEKDGEYCALDMSRENFTEIVRTRFGGDYCRLARAYYELVANVADRTGCEIVGHFDLITKYNEDNALFDMNDPRYLRCALDALDVLLEKDVIFEINTGAISRGHRRTPYPSPVFLRRIAEKRGRITVNSDAHKKENLLFGFEDAIAIARVCGMGSVTLWTRNGWTDFPL